jgi:hypothetical protein
MSEDFKSYISARVDRKDIDYFRDDTNVSSFINNRNGNKYYFKGTTGIAEIAFENDSTAVITIPYHGHYRRKKYIGVIEEHRTENKDISGKNRIKLTMTFFNTNLEDQGIIETSGDVHDPNSDAHQSAKNGLYKDVIQNLLRR